MPDKLLQEFRARAERLVPMPDAYALQAKGQRRRRALLAAGGFAMAVVLVLCGAVVLQTLDVESSVAPVQPIPTIPSPTPTVELTQTGAYVERNDDICRAAHERLNTQLLAAGYDLKVTSGDDGTGIDMIPTNETAQKTYDDAAVPILHETLAALRSHAPPDSARADFRTAYRELAVLIDSLDGVTNPDKGFRAIHFIEGPRYGLHQCTLSLGR